MRHQIAQRALVAVYDHDLKRLARDLDLQSW